MAAITIATVNLDALLMIIDFFIIPLLSLREKMFVRELAIYSIA
jgi:hypothetical protein